jgi:hypothetical protein
MDSRSFQKYLSRIKRPNSIEPVPQRRFRHAIVIPALAETAHLPDTFASLAKNPVADLRETMVLAVINNSAETDAGKVMDNQLLLQKLRNADRQVCGGLVPGESLFWIDASSPGLEISRKGGVGEARKLGMDAALPYLDLTVQIPPSLIFCLDADTLVGPDYLPRAVEFFSLHPEISGAVFHFNHQDSTDPGESMAIAEYELFMRYYVIALMTAGSPYAFYSLGSATVCTADAYVRAGGMRERNGGEDFYFMQALKKTGEIGQINSSCVFPSSRPSDRVPFGTGPRIREIMDGKHLKFYHPAIFLELKKLYAAVGAIRSVQDFVRLPMILEETISADAALFFKNNAFAKVWPDIFRNTSPSKEKMIQAFNVWFDAFMILKFIHFCENNFPHFQRLEVHEAFRMLFDTAGIALPAGALNDTRKLLTCLRNSNEQFSAIIKSY